MTNGSQVIARVPNPNSGIPHYTTASEVATMDFARNKLSLPVPKVLAWSSRASENPVGAEYIVMEKAPGTCLAQAWPNLSNQQKRDIVQAIVKFDVTALNHSLGGFGSLYYPNDIPKGIKHIPVQGPNDTSSGERWVLGPTTDCRFFDDGKGELPLDRGPWNTTKEYVTAICRREMEAIQNLKRPLRPEGIVAPGAYRPSRALKLSVCRDFLKVTDRILPPEPCRTPVLWHKDLHLDNIFVHPERHTEIVGLIDWQNTHVAPLFDQVTHPAFFDYKGPRVEGLTTPRLPEDFEELEDDAKKQAKKLLVDQTLYKYYDLFSATLNVPAYQALRYQDTLQGEIIALIGMTLNDGEPAIQGLLMKLVDVWDRIDTCKGGPPCPLNYSPADIERQQELELKWADGMMLMEDVLESLGGAVHGWEGFVDHENYEALKTKLAIVREQFIEYHAGDDEEAAKQWASAWPFQ